MLYLLVIALMTPERLNVTYTNASLYLIAGSPECVVGMRHVMLFFEGKA